jgi:hypothetical protein
LSGRLLTFLSRLVAYIATKEMGNGAQSRFLEEIAMTGLEFTQRSEGTESPDAHLKLLADVVTSDFQGHHSFSAANDLLTARSQLSDAGFTKFVRNVESKLRDPNLHVILDENDKVIGLNFDGSQKEQSRIAENPTLSNGAVVDESQDGKGATMQKHEFADPKKNFETTTSQDGNGVMTIKTTFADPSKKNYAVESSIDDKGVSTEKYKFDDVSMNFTVTAFVDHEGLHHENTEYADKSTQEITQDTAARKITIVKKSIDGKVESTDNQSY